MSSHNIHIIESNDWDRELVRTQLRALSRPVHILKPTDLDQTEVHIDVIILGISDVVSLETAQSQLARARSRSPSAQLILCAPRDLPDLDSRILQLKARAFLFKPLDEPTFVELLDETLGQIQLRKERQEYTRAANKASRISSIIGKSEAIREVLELLQRVAESASTSVLLLGESGTGKSLFAQTVHELCTIARGPFIEINCATLPTQLLESELFGYEPGAFTDAKTQKIGLIELADGGTLFLDEITEIDLLTQAKLLKFLDTKRFRRLGGEDEIAVETRIVVATNRDLKAEVDGGNFRADLYYRLNVVEIEVPPLRERHEDIDMITTYYLDFYKKKFNKSKLQLSDEARELIQNYSWPGNVRELINVIERAVLLSPDDLITPDRLPITMPSTAQSQATAIKLAAGKTAPVEIELPRGGVSLESIERAAIVATLEQTRGNVSKAAQMLGLSRGALRNKLGRHRIDPQQFATRLLIPS